MQTQFRYKMIYIIEAFCVSQGFQQFASFYFNKITLCNMIWAYILCFFSNV